MTIQERIGQELQRLQEADQELHKKVSRLHEAVEKLTDQLKVHLGEIKTQMTEYDDHGVSHSEKVLQNIEKLLREGGISRLSLLEAIVLQLCCYFHDAGMILPDCYSPLLAEIEKNPTGELPEDLRPWLKKEKKLFADVRTQFFCPETEEGYEEFLLAELDKYQKYRMGLPEELSGEARFRRTRHDYLRGTHGERAADYAKNLLRFFDGIPYGGKSDLAQAVGDICAAHCWEFGEVRKLETGAEIIDACPELRCNVRYLAMLLRLGDVIHFSADRASPTAYAERAAMDEDSEIHWKTKFEELHYTIKPDAGGVSIAYYAGFEDPKAYYFLQSHLDRVDEELQNYRAFVSDMRGEADADRYDIGLPTKVVRDSVRAINFKPDLDLKFKLEHRKIITLLMGMRLYRDEFMCLRELYQNALDACRCMRAENRQRGLTGDLKIEFGLGSDGGGDYLYCKDEGTGMTEDIVKNYLLRIGNSYYQSDEFRRANALLGGKVAPVSEFGIGMLSCYMIADRIEVITRHHTRTTEPPIWICMEGGDDYGYFRTPGRLQNNQVGCHGTYVKLYLKEEFKEQATGFIPEEPRDAVFLSQYNNQFYRGNFTKETLGEMEQFSNSLYHRIQQFVYIPEDGIPVWIQGENRRVQLFSVDEIYRLDEKTPILRRCGLGLAERFWRSHETPIVFGKPYIKYRVSELEDAVYKIVSCFAQYRCFYKDKVTGVAVSALIHLPIDAGVDYNINVYDKLDVSVSMVPSFTIDGLAVFSSPNNMIQSTSGMVYHFSGKIRPSLTVDRGDIREIPDAVKNACQNLMKPFQMTVVKQICSHFINHPMALTMSAKTYLFKYLLEKFDCTFASELLRELSKGILKDYPYFGAPLHEWFHAPILKLGADFLANENINGRETMLLYRAIEQASDFRFEDDKIVVKTSVTEVPRYDYEKIIARQVICITNWPKRFEQYDAVRNWPGLIPRRVFALLPDNFSLVHRINPIGYVMPGAGSMQMINPVQMKMPDWHDVLFALREKGEQCLRSRIRVPFVERGKIRHVMYIYINPRPLTEEDEAFLNQYCAEVPRYREGVEKGWSILFYNYKNGYVIAPGIVDRMEMLKLLPQEVWDHDDGLEYYFTDGTKAF